MKPFELWQVESPLVISVPHDGALIPSDVLSVMNPAVLDSTDRDYLIGEVFDFEDLAYSKIKANYSRHVIDLNRPADGKALYHNQAETALCPSSTFDFQSIYQAGHEPGQAEIDRRIELYWQPYHDQLTELIQSAKEQFGFCVLIDAHSIDDEVPRFFEGQLPDINVGTFDGRSCEKPLEDMVLTELAGQNNFTFVSNGRFKGGFITRHYGHPEKHIHAIQLEHAKGSYLDGALKLSVKADYLRQFWRSVFEKIILKMK
ncbi:N-formylglutamate amidohydrolase [Marinicella litoralis]|uniref:N-formylglutamate deformylase n=1 Tax=Marinicella litoralis TaxID=644220 RepID=A0A4R6XX32_9GAMM|nr:N-formylglutamate amidohydrolase [Marinicella litoralis]TDR22737.1 N-formylglutamate deformylase [Marinicella litoralis]